MLTDCHVHIYNAQTAEAARRYAEQEGLGRLFVTYREPAVLAPFEGNGVEIVPFLRQDDPRLPQWEERARGIKVHPRRHGHDVGFAIGIEALGPTLELAAEHGVPVLVHTDSDRPLTATVAALAEVARRTPEVTFLAAHLGSSFDSYFQESRGHEYQTADELQAAVEAGIRASWQALVELPNFYGDTTVFGPIAPNKQLLSETRAEIMIRLAAELAPCDRQHIVQKLLVGTDFPCFVPGVRADWRYPYAAGEMYRYQLAQLALVFPEMDEAQLERNVQHLLGERSPDAA